ncbi:MAG TPA: ribosome-associated translation inhibitor RaiA [Acidimicrobiales bacterium]|nr:ribosome-associated translation inhibitor RaiA [Acidimicrobiales bacterium]
MDIKIQGRKVEVPEALRGAVELKLARVVKHLDGMERAEVLFFEERNPRIADKAVCEVTMHGHGHVVRARAAAADQQAAVDGVVDKLEHRVEKLKGKLNGRSHPRRQGSVDSRGGQASTEHDDEEEGHPRIVRTKQFAIKPMTPEEAALQMELLSHDFFLFTNADTSAAAVVYRRKDGQIGLIDGA